MNHRNMKTGGCIYQLDGITKTSYLSILLYYSSNHLFNKPSTCVLLIVWLSEVLLGMEGMLSRHVKHNYIIVTLHENFEK